MWVAVDFYINVGTFVATSSEAKQPNHSRGKSIFLAMIATHSDFLFKPAMGRKILFKAVEHFLHRRLFV